MAHARQEQDSDGTYYVGRRRDTSGRWHQTAQYDSRQDAIAEGAEQEAENRDGRDGQR